jgi:hypothetical protein
MSIEITGCLKESDRAHTYEGNYDDSIQSSITHIIFAR